MPHRFQHILVEELTLDNYQEILPSGLAEQVESFLPPYGSFDVRTMRRYIQNIKDFELEDMYSNLTLANRLRLAFKDMRPDTICNKFPSADLVLKRRLRCVAEYLIRCEEFSKLRDEEGNLVKKCGALGKLVVIYQPLDKMYTVLQRQGLVVKRD